MAWVSDKHLLAWPVGFPLAPSSTWAGMWVGTLHMRSVSRGVYLPVCWPGFLSMHSLASPRFRRPIPGQTLCGHTLLREESPPLPGESGRLSERGCLDEFEWHTKDEQEVCQWQGTKTRRHIQGARMEDCSGRGLSTTPQDPGALEEFESGWHGQAPFLGYQCWQQGGEAG